MRSWRLVAGRGGCWSNWTYDFPIRFGVGRPVRSKLASLIPSSISSSLMTLADTNWSPARSSPKAAH